MIQIKENAKRYIINGIIAYVITFAIYNLGVFSTSDIILGIIFSLIFAFLCRFKFYALELNKKQQIHSHIITAIWTISYVIYAGESIKHGLENRMFAFVYILLSILGIYALFYVFCSTCIYYYGLKAIYYTEHISKEDYNKSSYRFPIKTWLIYSAILLLCMLPLFFLNFPGTMTVDSFDQLNQARGITAYSDHHPWVHTLLIELFFSIGEGITGNVTAGIGLYVFVQMCIVAISVGYAIACTVEIGMKKIYQYVILLGFVLYPYNLAYAITIWKDILFSASVLVFTVTIYRLFVLEFDLSARDITLLSISGIFCSLLRHNGFYAYIFTMLILLVVTFKTNKTRLLKLATIFILTVTLSLIVKGPVQKSCNVYEGDFAHNLAIPLQQIARTVVGNGASDTDLELLEQINSIEYIKNNYTPGGADNMIQWLVAGNNDYFMAHKGDFFILWFKLGIKNPNAYLQAYIEQTKGYYTTMMPEQIAYYGILPNNDHLDNFPFVGARIRIKINELCSKLQEVLPVYGIFYSMGACLLLVFLAVGAAFANSNGKIIYAYLPCLTTILSILIATPLVADLRYAYPLMMSFWTLVVLTIGQKYTD